MLSVGGGVIALSPQPDGLAEFQALKDWGADLLVTLTEAPERPPEFAKLIKAMGLAWRELPVPDYTPPSTPQVIAALPDLQARLASGQRIAIHCKGGCGRTGALVLRLMTLAGEEPEAALTRLREVRPCAVETEAQRLWAQFGREEMAD